MKANVKIDKEVEIKTPYYGKAVYGNKFIAITEDITFIVYAATVATFPEPFEQEIKAIVNGDTIECPPEDFALAYHDAMRAIKESFKTLCKNGSK